MVEQPESLPRIPPRWTDTYFYLSSTTLPGAACHVKANAPAIDIEMFTFLLYANTYVMVRLD